MSAIQSPVGCGAIPYPAEQYVARAMHCIPLRGGTKAFWWHVGRTFAVGATHAKALCRWANLDPETGKELTK